MAQSYEKAGVNLEAGYEVVRRIKKHVASTSRLGVMGNIGAFGGMFDLSALNVKEPVLVSGTDGVGTKLKLAFEMDKHDTIGVDAVAMCVPTPAVRPEPASGPPPGALFFRPEGADLPKIAIFASCQSYATRRAISNSRTKSARRSWKPSPGRTRSSKTDRKSVV